MDAPWTRRADSGRRRLYVLRSDLHRAQPCEGAPEATRGLAFGAGDPALEQPDAPGEPGRVDATVVGQQAHCGPVCAGDRVVGAFRHCVYLQPPRARRSSDADSRPGTEPESRDDSRAAERKRVCLAGADRQMRKLDTRSGAIGDRRVAGPGGGEGGADNGRRDDNGDSRGVLPKPTACPVARHRLYSTSRVKPQSAGEVGTGADLQFRGRAKLNAFGLARTRTPVYAVAILVAVAAAAASGHAVGASDPDLPTLVVVISLLALCGLRWGGTAGSAFVLTLALPLYDVGWLELHGTLVGLFTVLLLALLVAASRSVTRADLRRIFAMTLPRLLVVDAAIVAASLVVADRTGVSESLAKTYVARELLLPVALGGALVALRTHARHTMERLVRALLIGGVVGSTLAVLQIVRLQGYFAPPRTAASVAQFVGARAVGLAEAPGTWGSFMVLPLAFCLIAFIDRPAWWRGVLLAWLTSGLVLSGLRAAWVGVLVATLAAVLIRLRSPRRFLALVAAVAVGVAFPFSLGNFRLFLKGGGADTVLRLKHAVITPTSQTSVDAATAALQKQSVSVGKGRLAVDQSARYREVLSHAEVDLGLHHPLTGVGLGNIGPAIADLRPSYIIGHPETGVVPGLVVDPQNSYAGLFAELGIPGIVAFLAIVATALRSAYRSARDGADGLAAGTFVALAGTCVLALFWDSDRQVFLWWLVGMTVALEGLRRPPTPPAGS